MSYKLIIDFKSQTPIFQQIVDLVERQILSGGLKPGDYLVSVREFATRYTINPNTVAKAYQSLQAMDLVEVARGKGLIVKKMTDKNVDSRRYDIIAKKVEELITFADHLNFTKDDLVKLVKNFRRKNDF